MNSHSLPAAYFELIGRVRVFRETWYLDGDLEEYFQSLDLLLCILAEKPELRWILSAQRLRFLCREVAQLHDKMEVVPMPEGSEERETEMLKRFLHLLSSVRFPGGVDPSRKLELKGCEYESAADAATKAYFSTLPNGVKPTKHGWVRTLIHRVVLREFDDNSFE